MRKVFILLPAAILALVLVTLLSPSQMPAKRLVITAPASPTNTYPSDLPACLTEDGGGMALCYWDAQTMGNGEGTSLISGDCAPEFIEGQANSDMCLKLYGMGQVGIDAVGDCIEIDNVISDKNRAKEGFTIGECFKANLN